MTPRRMGAKITDDRGVRHALVPHETLLPGTCEPARRKRLVNAGWHDQPRLTRADWLRMAPYLLLMIVAVLLMGQVPALLTFRLHLRMPWGMLAAIPIGLAPAALSVWMMRRALPRRLAGVYLRAGFCASCGQDLTGLPRAEDGCTVCPECGAAWRVQRDQRSG